MGTVGAIIAVILGIVATFFGVRIAKKSGAEEERRRQATAAQEKNTELKASDATIDVRAASLKRTVEQDLREKLTREPTEKEVRDMIEKYK